MNPAHRLNRLRYRAWHRGTREADMIVGGFCDRHAAGWNEAELVWFERLLDEEDVDIMAWALGTQTPPPEYEGKMMAALMALDYVELPQRER